jgi:hypothetical protein
MGFNYKLNKKLMGLIKDVQQNEVSEQRRLPVDNVASDAIKAVTGEVVQLYYYNAGTLTIDAGQAAGVVAVGKLANRNIKNALGDVIGSFNDTSVSFTSTAFDNLVAFPYWKAELNDMNTGTAKAAAITEDFANGDYCIDHRTGTIFGVKKDASVTLTSTSYKVELAVSGGGGGIASDINVEEIGGQTVAIDDASMTANPAIIPIGGEYRAAPTAYTDGDAVIATFDAIGNLKVVPTNIGIDDSAFTVGVNAISPVGGIYVAAGDAVDTGDTGAFAMTEYRHLMVRDDSYDSSTQSNKVAEVSPLNQAYVGETLADVTDGADDTYYYYADMAGYRNFAAQMTLSGGSGTCTVTCEATLQDDGTAAASCTYQDVTNDLFGVASTTATDLWMVDTPVSFKYVRFKVVAATGAADDADWTIYFKKQY